MAFLPFDPGSGVEHSVLHRVVIKNSVTLTVGDAVALDTTVGFVTNAAAGAAIFGIVVGFVNAGGGSLTPTAYAAGTATSSDVTSVTAASDNQTNAMVKAVIEASPLKRWSAGVNGTIGTTAHSDVVGVGIDVDSANTNYARVLETTSTRTASTITNFFGWGADPNDSTRLIVSIAASQLNRKSG